MPKNRLGRSETTPRATVASRKVSIKLCEVAVGVGIGVVVANPALASCGVGAVLATAKVVAGPPPIATNSKKTATKIFTEVVGLNRFVLPLCHEAAL